MRRAVVTTFAGRRQRRALALPNEHPQPKLVFELADLLADARLRRIERLGRVRDIESVVDDRAEVSELLEVQGGEVRVRGGLYDPDKGILR